MRSGSISSAVLEKIQSEGKILHFEDINDSFFNSITIEMIDNEQMIRNFPMNKLENMLSVYPTLVANWNYSYNLYAEAKLSFEIPKDEQLLELIKIFIPQYYDKIMEFFTSLVSELKSLPKTRPEKPKAFNDSILLIASMALYHSNHLVMDEYSKNLESERSTSEPISLFY